MLSELINRFFRKNVSPENKTGVQSYALSSRPSSYYLEQFNEQCIEIVPYRPAGFYRLEDGEWIRVEKDGIHFPETAEQGSHTIQADGYAFEICFESADGQMDQTLFEIARTVLAQIVEMDSAARAIPSKTDYQEQLIYVDIAVDEVRLHYCSTIINTEWDAYFKPDQTGKWVFGGLG